jgi:HK97 family phage prohead protease
METTKELRYVKDIRVAGESRTIQGTAIVFDSVSEYMGFFEVISPQAVTQELIDTSDIVFLYNHEDDQIPLARSKNGKGTLKIMLTQTGVDFSFNAKKTAMGDEVLAAVQAGDLDSCSFAFAIADGGDAWSKMADGRYLRTINKLEYLRDFSIVSFPAYTATSVNTRGLDELKAMEERETTITVTIENEDKPEEEPADPAEPVEPESPEEPADIPEDIVDAEEEMKKYYTQYDMIIDKLKKC